jgi:HPt (histidine-containing phosphotransfer) domain-containing protein
MESTKEQDAEVLDEALALSSVGGDREFLAELVGLVQAAWPTLLADIRASMAGGDLPSLRRAGRLAKAAAHNVSARRAYDSALQLETAASMGDLRAALRARANLEQEVERLQLVLPTLVHPGPSL